MSMGFPLTFVLTSVIRSKNFTLLKVMASDHEVFPCDRGLVSPFVSCHSRVAEKVSLSSVWSDPKI